MVVFSYPIKLRTGFIFILTNCSVQILKGKTTSYYNKRVKDVQFCILCKVYQICVQKRVAVKTALHLNISQFLSTNLRETFCSDTYQKNR